MTGSTFRSLWVAAIAVLTWTATAVAQAPAPTRQPTPPSAPAEYSIGIDDVLAISVWLHPELERSVTVNAQGNVIFPPIGEVRAAGQTPRQLSERIADRLSTYLRQTTTVTVTVSQYLSRSVFVSGAVARPGRYGFESLPGILEVLSNAGGPAPNADLTRVQVVRRDAADRRVMTADVARAMRLGDETGLPQLKAGDLIVVPVAVGISGVAPGEGIAVIGAVNNPGVYPVGQGLDLWMVLAQAGGPSAQADLSRIKVLAASQEAQDAVTVNLARTLARGNRSPYVVRAGDVVYVNPRGPGTWNTVLTFLGVTRDVMNIVVLADLIKDRNR